MIDSYYIYTILNDKIALLYSTVLFVILHVILLVILYNMYEVGTHMYTSSDYCVRHSLTIHSI